MSFDLYFLRPTPGKSWEGLMAALEDEELRPLDDTDKAQWAAIKGRLIEVLPDADNVDGDEACELTDEATAIQLILAHRELSLSVPYGYDGPDAERLVQLLRRVVTTVEQVTGLTAYDPQADAPFTETGHESASAVFDQVHEAFHDPHPPTPQPAKRSGWRRLLGR